MAEWELHSHSNFGVRWFSPSSYHQCPGDPTPPTSKTKHYTQFANLSDQLPQKCLPHSWTLQSPLSRFRIRAIPQPSNALEFRTLITLPIVDICVILCHTQLRQSLEEHPPGQKYPSDPLHPSHISMYLFLPHFSPAAAGYLGTTQTPSEILVPTHANCPNDHQPITLCPEKVHSPGLWCQDDQPLSRLKYPDESLLFKP